MNIVPSNTPATLARLHRIRPAFCGLGREALVRRILHLVSLPPTTIPHIHSARIDRAFVLRAAWVDMERADAQKPNNERNLK